MSVEGRTEAILLGIPSNGKSPCFSRSRVLSVATLEWEGSVLRVPNIGNCLECAYCYGL
jgi:hypothetical protein